MTIIVIYQPSKFSLGAGLGAIINLLGKLERGSTVINLN